MIQSNKKAMKANYSLGKERIIQVCLALAMCQTYIRALPATQEMLDLQYPVQVLEKFRKQT